MGRTGRMLCALSVVSLVDYEDGFSERGRIVRTGVNGRYVLERAEHQHEHDPYAEHLNTAPGHVQHESLHRK